MCVFISWCEKKGNIYYLTYRDIYNTRNGKTLRDYCKRKEDLVGHGAIRYYYDNFEGGEDKECTDFSTPRNFPPGIVAAIKNNEMNLLAPVPDGLLKLEVLSRLKAYAERKKAYAGWKKAYAEWKKAYGGRKKAEARRKKAYAEWKKAYAEWKAEWEKADTQERAWAMFRIKKNRNPLWR